MSPLRLTGSTSGYSEIDAPAVAGDQTFTLPGTGGTLDRLNRAGNILQVVTASYTTTFTTTSGTYVDTGFSISITPIATSSKLLIISTGTSNITGSTAVGRLAITDSSNNVLVSCLPFIRTLGTGNGSAIGAPPYAMQAYIDATTTSSRSYKVRALNLGTGVTGISDEGNFLTIMEVAA